MHYYLFSLFVRYLSIKNNEKVSFTGEWIGRNKEFDLGDSAASDAKKNTVDPDNDDNRRKEKVAYDDDEDDDLIGALSYTENRYSPFNNPPEGNYRTRARWPAQPPSSLSPFDDFTNGNDWPRSEFPK